MRRSPSPSPTAAAAAILLWSSAGGGLLLLSLPLPPALGALPPGYEDGESPNAPHPALWGSLCSPSRLRSRSHFTVTAVAAAWIDGYHDPPSVYRCHCRRRRCPDRNDGYGTMNGYRTVKEMWCAPGECKLYVDLGGMAGPARCVGTDWLTLASVPVSSGGKGGSKLTFFTVSPPPGCSRSATTPRPTARRTGYGRARTSRPVPRTGTSGRRPAIQGRWATA